MYRLAIWLLLLRAAWGDGSFLIRSFTMHSKPPGAVITDHLGNVLGKTDQPFDLNTQPYQDFVEFNLHLPGYKRAHVTAVVAQLLQSGGIQETVTLEPTTTWVALKDWSGQNKLPLLLVSIVVLAGGAYLRNTLHKGQRALQREQKIQQMTDQSAARDSLLASVVGGKLLVEILGRGGMATVYRGVPPDTLDESQSVAVKILGRHQNLESDDEERFRREVNICSKMRHAGIVQLLEYGTHKSFMYLTMELVRGQTLRDQLVKEPVLSPEQAWGYLKPIFEAVQYAHERGVVHRDLKPDNVMLDQKGRPRVMDFGLAKTMNSAKLTAIGSVLGTPLYIAPEQIQGGQLDPRTDQYSLGIMAYELLTGQVPFQANDTLQLIMQHLQDEPKLPSLHRPELKPADEVLLRMLSKSPAERYPSLKEAAQELRRALSL